MKSIPILFSTLLLLTLGSCTASKMLKQQSIYEQNLKRIVNSDIPFEEKVDETAEIFNDVLQESLDYKSAKNSGKHINKFTQQNKATLNTLMDQMEAEMSKMSAPQQIQFALGLIQKPYIKSFMQVVPKVEKKINRKLRQVQIFGRFISILKPSLF